MSLMKKMAKIIKKDMERKAYYNHYDEVSPFDNYESNEDIEYESRVIKENSDNKKDEVFEGDLKIALEQYIDNFYFGKIQDYGYEIYESDPNLKMGDYSLMVETLPDISGKENPIICDLNYLYRVVRGDEGPNYYWDGDTIPQKLHITWKQAEDGYQFEAEIK